jgi:hypothetical protein
MKNMGKQMKKIDFEERPAEDPRSSAAAATRTAPPTDD